MLFCFCLASFANLSSVEAAKIPKKEQLNRKLSTVDTGLVRDYRTKLYPHIIDHSEDEVDPLSFLTILEEAYDRYLQVMTQSMTAQRAEQFQIIAEMNFRDLTPKIVRAIFPHDCQFADEVIALHEQFKDLHDH